MSNKYLELSNSVRDEFLNGLQTEGLKWFATWSPKCVSINGKTNANYRGINHLNLSFDGYGDTRYFTFEQATSLGYKVPKGSKSRKIVKFSFYDKATKKMLTPKEFDPKNANHTRFLKYYYVFNAEQLEGIELQPLAKPKYDTKIIAKIAKAMGVKVVNGTAKCPHYNIANDKIELPSNSLFKSQNQLYATALHELAHATGSTTRLNREFANSFGSKEYAYEELVAEMTSALLCSYLGYEKSVDDNHKAYVKSWISHIKNDSKVLIDAFKKSEEAFEFIVEIAELEGVREVIETTVSTEETTPIETTKVVAKKSNRKSKSTKKDTKKATTKVVETKTTKKSTTKVVETKATPKKTTTKVVEPKPTPKVETKATTKAKLVRQTQVLEDGIEYFIWNRNDGQAWIKLAKSYYDKMSKKEKRKFDRLWCC